MVEESFENVAPRNALNLYDFDIISSPKFLRKL
jgi:hypothetical protein